MLKKPLIPVEIDIIIISNAKNDNLYEETLKCIDSLYKSEDHNKIQFNVFIVESNKEVTYDYNIFYNNNKDENGHKIKTIYTDKEFGYHTYLNVGLEYASSEWSCLCNNDLVFNNGWATNILTVIESQRQLDPIKFKYVSASPCNPHETWHKENINSLQIGYGVRQQVAGWCLFQSSNIFDKIGKLDERIKFWFCDNWYAIVTQFKGVPHVFVGNSIVEHHNGLEGTTTKQIDISVEDKHNLTYGAGDVFREIIREYIGDNEWGKPTEEQKAHLKKQGKEWY